MKFSDLRNWYIKATSPKSTQDLTTFLEELPHKAGKAVLIAGSIAWCVAGVAVLYGSLQSDKISKLKVELAQTEALTPPVPTVQNISVEKKSVEDFAQKASKEYANTGVTVTSKNGKIEITGSSGRQFGVFREAVGHIQNGGEGWRVSVEQLCVGRDCVSGSKTAKSFLYGVFSVSRVKIEMPNKV